MLERDVRTLEKTRNLTAAALNLKRVSSYTSTVQCPVHDLTLRSSYKLHCGGSVLAECVRLYRVSPLIHAVYIGVWRASDPERHIDLKSNDRAIIILLVLWKKKQPVCKSDILNNLTGSLICSRLRYGYVIIRENTASLRQILSKVGRREDNKIVSRRILADSVVSSNIERLPCEVKSYRLEWKAEVPHPYFIYCMKMFTPIL